MLTNPAGSDSNAQCRDWAEQLIAHGDTVAVPEIADYEVRGELLRASKLLGVARLDALTRHPAVRYLPLTTDAMRLAATLWADARRRHRPAAADAALDADVILAAQAQLIRAEGHDVTVATTNVGHLTELTPASRWEDIR
jgi:predicted nucleic acid-binding protein